jgi:hypothetical protein
MEEKKNYKIPSILKKAAIQGYVYRWSTVVDNWIEERVLGLSWNSFKWILLVLTNFDNPINVYDECSFDIEHGLIRLSELSKGPQGQEIRQENK